jgi:hypothetical protein
MPGSPAHTDPAPEPLKATKRMVPPEVFLRAYLTWFGGLVPEDAARRAHRDNLFDRWHAYLGALGLPDHDIDAPRATQSNTVMLATLGRLGEALCVRSAEHDLHGRTPSAEHTLFAFEPKDGLTRDEFAERLDVLHRTFLGYPLALAPANRVERFKALYDGVQARGNSSKLSPSELAWAAVCTALVQHPEAGLY